MQISGGGQERVEHEPESIIGRLHARSYLKLRFDAAKQASLSHTPTPDRITAVGRQPISRIPFHFTLFSSSSSSLPHTTR